MEKNIESIVLGGGCFWCLDAGFRLVSGVTNVVSGYAGGTLTDPSYYDVVSGKTGHAEVVKVEFDTAVISLVDILDIFWAMHDPTTPDRQGHDVGPQYRSIILYSNERQRKIIEASVTEVAKLWDNPVVTEVSVLDIFTPAEMEHQDFFNKHPDMAYCQVIINPKISKLRSKFSAQLKS